MYRYVRVLVETMVKKDVKMDKITAEQLKRLEYLEEQEKKRQECINMLKFLKDLNDNFKTCILVDDQEENNASHNQ